MLKYLFYLFFSCLLIQSSWAAPICSDIHLIQKINNNNEDSPILDFQDSNFFEKIEAKKFDSQNLATYLDFLNLKYNKFLFSENILEKLQPNLSELTFSERIKARYISYKVNSLLKKINDLDSSETFELNNLSNKLIQLTFLTDPTVTKDMTLKERSIYRQAQQSIMLNGLDKFLFSDRKVNPSLKKKIFNLILLPFKDVYFRWSMAWLKMPQMNGVVLPIEIAEQIVWEGLYKTIYRNKEVLKPYLATIQGKSYFNIWSSVYNWSLVTAIFVGLPSFGYYKYEQIKTEGAEKLRPALIEMKKSAEDMNHPNYANNLLEKIAFEKFVTEFTQIKGREPTEKEKIDMHNIIRKRLGIQSDS